MLDEVRILDGRRSVGSADDLAAHLLRVLWRAGWAPLTVFSVNFVLVSMGWYPNGTDDCMHFSGGVAIAWFFHQLTLGFPRLLGRPSRLTLAVLIIALAVCAALAWEVGEFVLDPALSISLQPSLEDTLLDMVLGMAGATTYVTLRLLTDGLGRVANSREAEIRQ